MRVSHYPGILGMCMEWRYSDIGFCFLPGRHKGIVPWALLPDSPYLTHYQMGNEFENTTIIGMGTDRANRKKSIVSTETGWKNTPVTRNQTGYPGQWRWK